MRKTYARGREQMLGRLQRLVGSVRQDQPKAAQCELRHQLEPGPPVDEDPLNAGQETPPSETDLDSALPGQPLEASQEAQDAPPEPGHGKLGLPVDPGTGLYRWWVFCNRLIEEVA